MENRPDRCGGQATKVRNASTMGATPSFAGNTGLIRAPKREALCFGLKSCLSLTAAAAARNARALPGPSPSQYGEVGAYLEPEASRAVRRTIQVRIRRGDRLFVAECLDLPVVTQAATLDELAAVA